MNEGADIIQNINSNPGIALGPHRLGGMDFAGTFYIDDDNDNDSVGVVFSFVDNTKFYLVNWKKTTQAGGMVSY